MRRSQARPGGKAGNKRPRDRVILSVLPWIFALGLVCLLIERLRPGWKLPEVRTWPFRVVLVNAFQLGVVLLAGMTWDRWLTRCPLFDLGESVSPALGGFVAYLAGTFVFYWWHRWRHRVDAFWRFFHQIHHTTVPAGSR